MLVTWCKACLFASGALRSSVQSCDIDPVWNAWGCRSYAALTTAALTCVFVACARRMIDGKPNPR